MPKLLYWVLRRPPELRAAQKRLSSRGSSLSVGHTHQLVAAMLGHNNLASYQATGDDAGLPYASDIVLDQELLRTRATELEHDAAAFAQELTDALQKRFPDAVLYDDGETWLIDVQCRFEQLIVDEDAVNSQVAMTNGTLPRADIELPWWDGFDENDDELSFAFEGLVTVDQDEDRVYWGHEIEVCATLTVERYGRRLFGRQHVAVERAKLRWLGEVGE
jgi:hypothetical protein